MAIDIDDIQVGTQIELYDKAHYKRTGWRKDLGVPYGWGNDKKEAELLYGTIQTVREIENKLTTYFRVEDLAIGIKPEQIKSIVPKHEAHSILDKRKKSNISSMQMRLNLHLAKRNKQ